jgi:predicted SprT family Zn-dependent metalloprotease
MRLLSPSRTGGKQNRTIRLFKQLEFLVVGQALRLPNVVAAPLGRGVFAATERRGYSGRDHALEEKSRTLLRDLGAAKLASEIRVEWNPRLKTAAGRADYRQKLVSLNPRLRDLNDRLARTELATDKLDCLKQSSLTSASEGILKNNRRREVVPDEIARTLRHELAHLLAQFRVGRRRIAPHGAEWREACRDLGIADEARCHNLPFATKVYPARFVYRCPNCRREFPRLRRIRRAIACLACCRKHNNGEFDPRFRLKLTTKL